MGGECCGFQIDLDCMIDLRDCLEGAVGVREPVTLRLRTWSGTRVGAGTFTDTDTLIQPDPLVQFASLRQIANSGGRIEEGTAQISRLPLSMTLADLKGPALGPNQEFYYLIRGQHFIRLTEPQREADQWTLAVRRVLVRGATP